jgi:hypothetical protein
MAASVIRPARQSASVLALCVLQAALLVTSGWIHLHLAETAYKHVKTLGPLFVVQFVSCLVVALALLLTRHLLVALASIALMAGTIVGFILARTVGIFDFELPYSTTLANQVLTVEIAAVVVGAAMSVLMWKRR